MAEITRMNGNSLGSSSDAWLHAPDMTALPMSNTVRDMLLMAAESAFALRAGQDNSPLLERFAAQGERLDAIIAEAGTDRNSADYQFLVTRARNCLSVFRDTVRSDIAGRIDDGTPRPSFDEVLDKARDTAIAAGAAIACLEMALRNGK